MPPDVQPFAGTSPHTWGKRAGGSETTGGGGNIPAYAGKTLKFHGHILSVSEHPRVCGENSAGPLVGLLRGNIPAYAGKTQDAELWAIGP